MRLFQAALGTCLDSPFFASLSVHGLHFTVYALELCDNTLSKKGSEKALEIALDKVVRRVLRRCLE